MAQGIALFIIVASWLVGNSFGLWAGFGTAFGLCVALFLIAYIAGRFNPAEPAQALWTTTNTLASGRYRICDTERVDINLESPNDCDALQARDVDAPAFAPGDTDRSTSDIERPSAVRANEPAAEASQRVCRARIALEPPGIAVIDHEGTLKSIRLAVDAWLAQPAGRHDIVQERGLIDHGVTFTAHTVIAVKSGWHHDPTIAAIPRDRLVRLIDEAFGRVSCGSNNMREA